METQIFFLRTDDLEDFLNNPIRWEFLCEERKEKINRFQKKSDKLRALGAGLLLEYGLREHGMTQVQKNDNTSLKPVKICYGLHGKPKLAGKELPFFFNLSHSQNKAAVIFSNHEVGIDIEKIRIDKQNVARRFFSKEENEYLEKNWNDSEFTKIWTRKESYIKARGLGMSLAFDSFCTLEEKKEDFFWESYRFEEDMWMSVCQKEKKAVIKPKEITEEVKWYFNRIK